MDEDRRPVEDGGSDALKESVDPSSAVRDPGPERLPRSVRRGLDSCAEQWTSQCGAERRDSGVAVPAEIILRRRAAWLPWSLCVAGILLAIAGWWPRLSDPSLSFNGTAIGQWWAEHARARMLGTASGVGQWRWQGDAGGGPGDVVWDRRAQRGFLLLRGFVPNDPARARYQLWIFDGARDDRYPVDGGVFDVPAGRDEVIIPVKAALPVTRPTGFAVTVERPGGAVVSTREKLVAYAAADG
jgi:hypothetical protein